MVRALLRFIFTLLAGAALCSVAWAEESSCLICHSEIKVDYQASIHVDYDITCVACHGGDPSRVTMEAMAPEAGFRGRLGRVEVPELCASCHSDAERMKPSNIPIDQYAEYLTSRHGLLLAQGDAKVAVCTDCHGTHRILTAEEPASMIYPENVPRTCARCHSDEELMEGYGIPADQYERFVRGVHGMALLEEENRKAPSCATCHGAHGAAPPGVSDISKVCGQCHIKTRDFFNESPHKRAMDERKISECSSCHGSHLVEVPGPGVFDDTCVACHARGSEPFLVGQKLETVLVEAEKAVGGAEEELVRAEEMGFEVSIYRSRLLEAHSYLTEAISVQHTLDLDRVGDLTRKARSLGEEVRGDALALISSTRVRAVGLAISWVFITFAILVAYLYRRRLGHDASH